MRLRSRANRGVSLVEVLVALVLVSCGALSALSLQFASRAALAEGQQRLSAVRIARAMADAIRTRSGLDGTAVDVAGQDGSLQLPTACLGGPSSGGDGVYTVTLAWRGSVRLPDDPAVRCGLDPQPDGARLYSEHGDDNAYRRTLVLPFTLAASRQPH